MIDAVISRLEAQVAELQGRVEGAGNFAELTRSKRLPQVTPAAHVLPMGFVGRGADASAGAFTQVIEEAVAVILTVRDQGQSTKAILADLRGFLMRIIEAVAGWAPVEAIGVFRFVRGSLISSAQGTFIYQLDFAITDQLRIL